jgi:predicted nucleotidyltransferase
MNEDLNNTIISCLKDYNPEMIGIFGSFARNENTPNSDIDILVRFKKTLSLLQLINIENNISKKLGIKVDLVTEGAIKDERIKAQITRDLKIIFS